VTNQAASFVTVTNEAASFVTVGYTEGHMDTPSPELVAKALRKIMAAVEGMKQKAVAVGALARRSWGAKKEPPGVELLLAGGPDAREQILGAARGEGLQQAPGGTPLHLVYPDAKLGGSAPVTLVEATTLLHKRAIERAQPGSALNVPMLVASCEDLILLAAASEAPGEREGVIELLRHNAGRVDGAYLKREAEAAGIFDRLKSAWQEAKSQG
jgi:hypothetical protein